MGQEDPLAAEDPGDAAPLPAPAPAADGELGPGRAPAAASQPEPSQPEPGEPEPGEPEPGEPEPGEPEPGEPAAGADESGPERPLAVALLEPRDGLPPLVTSAEALREAVRALGAGEGPVAVDAERASGYRYGHRAFLVQLRRRGAGTVLIDPVACPDLSDLDAALNGTEAVLHAASQDLPCLADLGYRPQQLFDTELAGRLLGYPRVGLGPLVENVLGLALEKGYAAADWSTRPLPEDWLRYAALDVEVLVELRDVLAAELAAQGKDEWAREEFTAVLNAGPAPPRTDPWRRTSGIHRVRTRRGLAIVRELWLERDRIAQRRDLSPGRVLPDSAIVEAARAGPTTQPALAGVPGFKGRGAKRHAQEWFAAIRRAHTEADQALPRPSAQVSEGPPPAHRWHERDPEAARRLAAVRAVIAALSDEHSVPAENLLQPDSVRRLAWQPPDPVTVEAVATHVSGYGARPWQVLLTSGPIAGALLRLAEKGDE